MHDVEGSTVWSAELNCYGQVENLVGKAKDCPFRHPGQYEDVETGLYYNRFRYYSPEEGMYISQDPIGLEGGIKYYSYVKDVNTFRDYLGLAANLVEMAPLPDATQVFRISTIEGIAAFKPNLIELKAANAGKLNPQGVSVIRATIPNEAMDIWNNAFPDRSVGLESVRGASASDIRKAGFDVIHNPSRNGALKDSHARLVHQDGFEKGFTDQNLNKLSNTMSCQS